MGVKITYSRCMSVELTEDRERVREFLREQNVGVLSTISADGSPDAAVVYMAINDDLTLSFMTKANTTKHTNIQKDNRVAITIFEPKYQTTVQIKGNAKVVNSRKGQQKIFDELLEISMQSSGEGMPPITKMKDDEYVAYQVTPTFMRMAVFSRPEQDGHDQIFETVIS